jgi:hypothetical protein
MPSLIVIPLLSGMHWRTIAIQINYESNNIDVVWDDPYGNFPEQLKQLLLIPIKVNVLRLLNSNNQIINEAEVVNELTEETINILQHNNAVDQEGNGQNGWDCGPITVSNIRDYIYHYVINSNLPGINYTVDNYDEENHEDTIKDIRINHINQYRDVAEIGINSERLDSIRVIWESDKKTQLKSIEEKFSQEISNLDDFYLSMFFTILENYKQFTQTEEDIAIKYAIDFIQEEKFKEIIIIKPQLEMSKNWNSDEQKLTDQLKEIFSLPKSLIKLKGNKQANETFLLISNTTTLPDNKEYPKCLDLLKNKVLKELLDFFNKSKEDFDPSTFTYEVSELVRGTSNAKEIVTYIDKFKKIYSNDFASVTQKQLLEKFLKEKNNEYELDLNEDFSIQKLPDDGHANAVYMISNHIIDKNDPKTIDYYAKTFSKDSSHTSGGLIDPREAFLYKVLDLVGYGPKCWFLLKSSSSSMGTMSGGNFILTKNLSKEGVNFLLDKEENKKLFEQALLDMRKFAIEFSAAAAINDILALRDTFKNPGNYGLVFYENSVLYNAEDKDQQECDEETKITKTENYKIFFIDHLPNASNGILAELNSYKNRSDLEYNSKQYSPRESVISSNMSNPSALIKLAKGSKDHGVSKTAIINDVLYKLYNNSDEILKKQLNEAKECITYLINQHRDNFCSEETKTAFDILENYYQKILSNLEIFDEKYKENTDQDSYGIQHSGNGMSDKDISLNLQSLKYNVETNNKKSLFYIEEEILNERNIIDKIEYCFNSSSKQNEFFSIVTVTNDENKKHAILLHAKQEGNSLQITLIDPLSQEDTAFSAQINALKNTLNNQKQCHVQIIYAECQDKDHGTCGDMSLIMLQDIIEQISNKSTISLNNQITVYADQTSYDVTQLHNFDYDKLHVEAMGEGSINIL